MIELGAIVYLSLGAALTAVLVVDYKRCGGRWPQPSDWIVVPFAILFWPVWLAVCGSTIIRKSGARK